MDRAQLLFRYRLVLGLFIVALVLSGLTAFPLQWELDTLTRICGLAADTPATAPEGMARWLVTVREGLRDTYAKYPWMAYGTDWLAFAHVAIAVFFLGPLISPVRNVWVLWAGIIACILVVPLAHFCGPLRGIPVAWRLIDCAFGVIGIVPLLYCVMLTRRLKKFQIATP